MTVVDIWANIIPPGAARHWKADEAAEGARRLFGGGLDVEHSADDLLSAMDAAGVDTAVVPAPLRRREQAHPYGYFAADDYLELADAHPGRILVAVSVNDPTRRPPRPRQMVDRVRELAGDPRFVLVRITPFLDGYELNHRRYYPLYALCEELGLPVSINVGVPGPRARSAPQHPELLEDVLLDFPDLVVIGAHMGHPYEALLVSYMMKWENLYLSNSAYLADYMDPALVRFMNSSRGRGRVLFASDHPVLPMSRALESARKLDLTDDAMAAFLGATATRLLTRDASP